MKFRVFWNGRMYYTDSRDDDWYLTMGGSVCDFSFDGERNIYDDAIVMFGTGLKDLNDRDVYEGDVVMYGDVKYTVVLYQGGFKIECGDVVLDIMLDYPREVIGNIYEGEQNETLV